MFPRAFSAENPACNASLDQKSFPGNSFCHSSDILFKYPWEQQTSNDISPCSWRWGHSLCQGPCRDPCTWKQNCSQSLRQSFNQRYSQSLSVLVRVIVTCSQSMPCGQGIRCHWSTLLSYTGPGRYPGNPSCNTWHVTLLADRSSWCHKSLRWYSWSLWVVFEQSLIFVQTSKSLWAVLKQSSRAL